MAGAILLPSPPDGEQIATDLHTLLDRAHVPGPYVLAGHSFGGLYVRTYAAKYPEEVAGLVLIDSTAATNKPVSQPEAGSYSVQQHVSALFGDDLSAGAWSGSSPASASRSYRRGTATTPAPPLATGEVMSGVLGEYGTASRSMAAAGRLRSLDAKPLIVLTAERGNAEGWMADQRKMVTLSTNSLHRVVPGATHGSFVEDPKAAAAITKAVHDVVVSTRTGEPLKGP